MRRVICALLAALMALSAVGYAEKAEEEIKFADPVLENIMRKIVDNPEGAPTKKALAGVREINIGVDWENTPDSEKVHDLSGLEYCEELFSLSLYGHAVEDISPLAGMPLRSTRVLSFDRSTTRMLA